MAGSVTRQGTTWQYVVDLGIDGNGRRRQYRGELANPGRRSLEDQLTQSQWCGSVTTNAPATT